MLWLDGQRSAVGEPRVLHISTLGATECAGQRPLPAALPVNGRLMLQPMAPGRHRLDVSCRGAGGPVVRSISLAVPLPVLATSYQNRQPMQTDAQVQTAGDFFQEGRWALFTVRSNVDGTALASFLAQDEQGRWTDRSTELLIGPQERRTCADPRQAITADFNRDGKPDVYLACNGASAASHQTLFLSQPDGTYRKLETPFGLRSSQAEAGDLDGDGHIDVITIDTSSARALVLWGRGDGTLEIDASRMPLVVPDRLRIGPGAPALNVLDSSGGLSLSFD